MSKIVGSRGAPAAKVRRVDEDDAPSFSSDGKRNSTRAKRKAAKTRLRKERERAAHAAEIRRRERDAARAHGLIVIDELGRLAPLPLELRERLERYLVNNPHVVVTVSPVVSLDDYREKIARPGYLTKSTPRTQDDQ